MIVRESILLKKDLDISKNLGIEGSKYKDNPKLMEKDLREIIPFIEIEDPDSIIVLLGEKISIIDITPTLMNNEVVNLITEKLARWVSEKTDFNLISREIGETHIIFFLK